MEFGGLARRMQAVTNALAAAPALQGVWLDAVYTPAASYTSNSDGTATAVAVAVIPIRVRDDQLSTREIDNTTVLPTDRLIQVAPESVDRAAPSPQGAIIIEGVSYAIVRIEPEIGGDWVILRRQGS